MFLDLFDSFVVFVYFAAMTGQLDAFFLGMASGIVLAVTLLYLRGRKKPTPLPGECYCVHCDPQ